MLDSLAVSHAHNRLSRRTASTGAQSGRAEITNLTANRFPVEINWTRLFAILVELHFDFLTLLCRIESHIHFHRRREGEEGRHIVPQSLRVLPRAIGTETEAFERESSSCISERNQIPNSMRRAAVALRPLHRLIQASPRPLPLRNSSSRPISTTSLPSEQLPLHDTTALLRQLDTLLSHYPVLSSDNQLVWRRRLNSALNDLATPRRARIAGQSHASSIALDTSTHDFLILTVVGDGESGASTFVTAAFDDPLASDGEISLALASRRIAKDAPDLITLSSAQPFPLCEMQPETEF